jgi:hypothetical protein
MDVISGGCLEGELDKLLEGNKDRDLLRLLPQGGVDGLIGGEVLGLCMVSFRTEQLIFHDEGGCN